MKPYIFPIILFVLLILSAFLYYQNNKIDITNYHIKSKKITKKVKIIHLSDLHSKPFKKVLNIVKNNNPDIIVITGDFINDKGKNKEKMLAFGKKLVAIAPVYYVTGNHERRLDYFDDLMCELKKIGFHVLLNELTCFKKGNDKIHILGLDENQANFEDYKARKKGIFKYKDMKPNFDLLNEKDGFKIVLSHYPENFEFVKEQNFSQYDFDIQFSGHAHGGQFILPFIGPVFSPGQGLFPKYAKGAFGKHPMLIVSRGLGNAEFPFRLFNHPEIIVATIIPNDKI